MKAFSAQSCPGAPKHWNTTFTHPLRIPLPHSRGARASREFHSASRRMVLFPSPIQAFQAVPCPKTAPIQNFHFQLSSGALQKTPAIAEIAQIPHPIFPNFGLPTFSGQVFTNVHDRSQSVHERVRIKKTRFSRSFTIVHAKKLFWRGASPLPQSLRPNPPPFPAHPVIKPSAQSERKWEISCASRCPPAFSGIFHLIFMRRLAGEARSPRP